MDPSRLALVLVLLPLALASALCAATETALFSLTYSDRLRLRRQSPAAAHAVGLLLERPRALLVSILLATNISNVAYLVVSSVIALTHRPAAHEGEAALIAVGLSALSVLGLIIVGDLLPKLLARRLRVGCCRLFAPALLAVFRAFAPVQGLLETVVIAPLARLVRPPSEPTGTLTSEELSALLHAGARQGAIETAEQRLLEEVVQLGEVRVREAMVPRLDILWIDAGAPLPDLLERVRAGAPARIVLCRGSLDDGVLGWVDTKRAVSAWAATPGAPPPLTAHVRPMLYVPETARLDQLLDQFRATRRYVALCVDEYGTIVGLIDLNDILVRLVAAPGAPGEEPRASVEPAGEGRWLVPGRFGVRELTAILESSRGGLRVRGRPVERRVSTVAGLVLLALGRLPRIGDEVRFGNVTLRVESMEGRTIERVLIAVDLPGPPGAREGA